MAGIEYPCPICKKALTVEEKRAGLIFICTVCGAPTLVPAKAGKAEPAPAPAPALENPAAQAVRERIAQSLEGAHKTGMPASRCPYCQSVIVANAILCLKCGRDLRSGRKVLDGDAAAGSGSGASTRGGAAGKLAALLAVALAAGTIYYFFDDIAGWVRRERGTPVAAERVEEGGGSGVTIATTDGRVYTDCRKTLVQPDAVTFTHAGGITRIPYEKLPPAVAKQYGYNPAQAAAHAQVLEQRREQGASPVRVGTVKKEQSVPCSKCNGTGRRATSFGHSQRRCLACGGDGTVAGGVLADSAAR